MATNKATTENILNSNNFQVFLDSLMASDNNGLSSFLANQVKEDTAEINAGKATSSAAKLSKKKKKVKRNRLHGTIKHSNNNTLYVPAIHNGTTNENVSVVVGSTNPSESSAYKNMLKTDLMKEVDETFARMLLDNKIPVINSGNVLSYIEVEPLENGEAVDDITGGARSKPKRSKGSSGITSKLRNLDLVGINNGETVDDLTNGAKHKRPVRAPVRPSIH